MSNRFLQKILLFFAFSIFSLGKVSAIKVWHDGDTIYHTTHSAFNEDVSWDGTLTVSKDIYISARNGYDLTVNATTRGVYFRPKMFLDGNVTTTGYAHIIFHADATSSISVICDYDILFRGRTDNVSGRSIYEDLILTFSGQGTTTFKLKEDLGSSYKRGVRLDFQGLSRYGFGDPAQTIQHYGVRVNVLMDQTETQAVTNAKNKLVFQRKTIDGESGTLETSKDNIIKIEEGCYFTYFSDNDTGSDGFGSIAVDVSNNGTGKIILYNRYGRPSVSTAFGGGSFMVFGHYVDSYSESDIRQNAYLNKVGGKRAILRIIDKLAYDNTGSGYDPSDSDARGLMVVNSVLNNPKLASDPYQEFRLTGASPANHPNNPNWWADDYSWVNARTSSYSPDAFFNVQPGFILGVNGQIDVYHKTFFNFVSRNYGTENDILFIDKFASEDYNFKSAGVTTHTYETCPYLKKKNPSAFYVDGLHPQHKGNYVIDKNAQIYMYGDSKLLFYAAKPEFLLEDDRFYNDTAGEYVYSFTVDKQPYNGQYIYSSSVTTTEGREVLVVEGPLDVRKLARSDTPGRTYGTTGVTDDRAIINLPTITVDHTGREYDFTGALGYTNNLITRPLTKDYSYEIYDSPSVFLNDHVELYNVNFVNGDITKILSADPSTAVPNFVGGERKYFNDTIYSSYSSDATIREWYQLGQFRLYNSRLDLHEHFVAAGCRFVVREQTTDKDGTAVYGLDASNTSTFMFYDHGEQLDTLDHAYGRLFMASCSNNKMSDNSANETLENCFINVYRQNQINSPNLPAQTIKLSLQSADDDDNPIMDPLVYPVDAERAHHLVLLNRANNGVGYMDVGWTTTVGDKTRYTWESLSGLGSNYFDIKVTTSGDPNVGTTNTPPATVSIDGNYFYFGGTDWMGNKAIVPVTTTGKGSVVYVNHGGRFTITQPAATEHGYDSFIDLPIAYRLWSYEGLRGIVDLPKDQVIYGYGFGRQPYNVNTVTTDAGSPIGVHLDTYNISRVDGYSGRISADRYSGEEYILPWSQRIDQNTPVKISLDAPLKAMLTRYTGIIDQPVTMPSNIIYFGAGDGWADIVTQLKVSGATIADPLHLLIDGYSSGPGYAWVKEIVSVSSNPSVHGEGDHGIIFLRNGGRLGLGNNSWNSHSLNSWKLLGKDYLTISPSGNSTTHSDLHTIGIIDLNSDVYVVDRGAFVAESNFGEGGVDRLTINLNGNDLYIPAGKELDLSSFGKNGYRQEIEFAGEGRVILGHGSVIRFPASVNVSSVENAPVLYFNDNTKLVVEDDPELGKGKYTTITAADADKVKVYGIGQIWLNKDARFEIMGGGKMRVGSDADTPYTWFRLSLQRQGDWMLGDEQERGGSFEVGNPSAITGTQSEEGAVSFELVLNGAKARTHLDRGAFLGFGVGVIDKSYDLMNGTATLANNPVVSSTTGDVNFSPDTTNAWKVQTLYDVWKINITINEGTFDHSNIFNGGDRKAAMLAIGPIYSYNSTAGSYTFELTDPDRSKVLGGGNIMFLDEGITTWINAWDFADPKPREAWQSPAEDYGYYNMLASDMIIQQQESSNFANSTLTKLDGGGIKMVTGSNREKDLFDFILTSTFRSLDTKLVNCGSTQYRTYVGYVNTPQSSTNYSYATGAEQIYRLTGISVMNGQRPEDGVEIGVLGATGSNEPVVYSVVNRR
ncbi:hypothetical protein GF385_01810 [Candidatus Dependentiae bacterium]|nr:hypothetical protein [Candidatus Dependentiae bacterium]